MKHKMIALGLFALAGCASAQMRLPEALVAGERTEFTGIGGWASGQFSAGPYAGDYQRSAVRLTYDAPIIENRGGSRFTLAGAGLAPVEGRCWMRERSVDLGLVEVTTRPMAYRCEFLADGQPLSAWLELQEFTGRGAAPGRYERRGAITFGGETMQIRSAHDLAGAKLPTATPIGYTFEQNGHAVGAVELNGKPVLSVMPGVSAALRRTMTVAALALGVFWDPANLDT